MTRQIDILLNSENYALKNTYIYIVKNMHLDITMPCINISDNFFIFSPKKNNISICQ